MMVARVGLHSSIAVKMAASFACRGLMRIVLTLNGYCSSHLEFRFCCVGHELGVRTLYLMCKIRDHIVLQVVSCRLICSVVESALLPRFSNF